MFLSGREAGWLEWWGIRGQTFTYTVYHAELLLPTWNIRRGSYFYRGIYLTPALRLKLVSVPTDITIYVITGTSNTSEYFNDYYHGTMDTDNLL